MLQQSSRNNFLTRVAGAFSPAALGNKLPGFLLSNFKIFKHENKNENFTRHFFDCSKFAACVFAFLMAFQHLSGQVVSGRVGVFRDSIYLNGVWYKSLGSGGITGSGTANYLPVFNGSNSVTNSIISNPAPNQILIGNPPNNTGALLALQGNGRAISIAQADVISYYTLNGVVNDVMRLGEDNNHGLGIYGGFYVFGNNNNLILDVPANSTASGINLGPNIALYINNSGPVLYTQNRSSFLAKNTSGTYETYLWPRSSDDVMYLNYGSNGFNIRNNNSVSTMFMTNSNKIGIGTTTPDSALQIVGGLHATYGNIDNNLIVGRDVSATTFNTASGSVNVRTSGYISVNGTSSSVNVGSDVLTNNVWVRMDTLFSRTKYNLVSPNPVNVLIINNQLSVPDTVYIPSSSSLSTLTFTGGNRPTNWNGAARIVYLVNLTPAAGQSVVVYPQPGETLNGGPGPYTLPANSISMVVGLNGANVIK